MIPFTALRFVFITILALSSALCLDAKNGAGQPKEELFKSTAPTSVPAGLAAADWTTIRDAYEAGRHAAYSANGGVQFRNPGQQWSTQFDGRGFVIKPDAGSWSWGLQLKRYGTLRDERSIATSATIQSNGARVDYIWDSNLTEWYKNDGRGLEHGFTVHSRPANSNGILTLELGVVGDLRATVNTGGHDVRFVDSNGMSILNYSGLSVVDADGKSLPAHFETTKNSLRLAIEELGARYPLTIDPIVQQAYLKASNTGANDRFGYAVAVSGNTVVVGAIGEASNATGVNGNQTNNSATNAGAAYVFVRTAGTWSQQAYLKASNTAANDQFGYSVAIAGDTIVVGAISEDSNATGVNGNQASNSAADSGAAYVFVRSGTTWTQQAYLKQSNTESGDLFGYFVAISGDTIISGAIGESSGATGVNGNQMDNSVGSSGAVYVFVRSGGTWTPQAYLKASNTGSGDRFGIALAISGETAVVGAYLEDSDATGVNGNGNNDNIPDSGAAYVFVRSGGAWTQQAYLKASNTGPSDTFGIAVTIAGDTIAVGAIAEDSNATGSNGNQADNSLLDAGAVYVFQRSGTTWTQQAYLKSSNSESVDLFGYSLALSGDVLAVGAFTEDSNATGINGNQSNNSAPDAGAVYLFSRSASVWSQIAYLKASNAEGSDFFGVAVGLSGDLLAVGSYLEDSNATGVNGHQNFNSASGSGAVYVFDVDLDPGILSYGTGTPGCAGTHTLGVTQAPLLNSPNFAFTCDNAPPLSLGLGLVTDSQDLAGSDPFSLGVLLHCDFIFATEVFSFDFYSDGTGYSETVGAVIPNNPLIAGKTFYASALWAWPTSTCILPGFNPYNLSTSRGLAMTILVP